MPRMKTASLEQMCTINGGKRHYGWKQKTPPVLKKEKRAVKRLWAHKSVATHIHVHAKSTQTRSAWAPLPLPCTAQLRWGCNDKYTRDVCVCVCACRVCLSLYRRVYITIRPDMHIHVSPLTGICPRSICNCHPRHLPVRQTVKTRFKSLTQHTQSASAALSTHQLHHTGWSNRQVCRTHLGCASISPTTTAHGRWWNSEILSEMKVNEWDPTIDKYVWANNRWICNNLLDFKSKYVY